MDAQLEKDLALDLPVPEVYAVAEDVIVQRYQTFSAVDPLPDVPSALLNSADLLDYVADTGMIYPFRIDMAEQSKTLKPATYGVPLLGKYVYWQQVPPAGAAGAAANDATYEKQVGELNEGDEPHIASEYDHVRRASSRSSACRVTSPHGSISTSAISIAGYSLAPARW